MQVPQVLNMRTISLCWLFIAGFSFHRQCMCCYSKDGKNLDRMNNIVQVVLRTAIEVIKNLPDLLVRERRKETSKAEEQAEEVASSSITDKGEKITGKNDNPSAEKEEKSEGADSKAKESAEGKDKKDETMEDSEKEVEEEDLFSAEEKVRLLDFTCKVFMVNFPMYCAQKILTPTTLEVSVFSTLFLPYKCLISFANSFSL